MWLYLVIFMENLYIWVGCLLINVSSNYELFFKKLIESEVGVILCFNFWIIIVFFDFGGFIYFDDKILNFIWEMKIIE